MIRKIFIRVLKILGWTVAGVVVLLLLVVGVIQIPVVQNAIVGKGVRWVQGKIGTPVTLEHFSLRFPKKIVLKGLYLEDQQKDTLLYAGEIAVDTDLWGLLHHRIQLNDVSLQNINAKISRTQNDSAFNFNYIVKAFSSDSIATPKDTTATPWKISLKNAEIEKTHFVFDDHYTGNEVNLKVGSLDVSMDEMDLDKSTYKIDEVSLANISAIIVQSAAPAPAAQTKNTSDSSALNLGLRGLNLKNIHIKYSQQALGQYMQLDLAEGLLDADKIDLIAHDIALNKFELKKSFISYQQMAGYAAEQQKAAADTTAKVKSKPWTISLDKFTLADNAIQFYDFNKPFIRGAVDFNHIWITGLNMQIENVKVNGDEMEGALARMSLHERSGFGVKDFRTSVRLSSTKAELNDFYFDTGHSRISIDARASYHSLENIAKDYPNAKINLSIEKIFLSVVDLLYFQPHALDSLPLKNPRTIKMFVEGKAVGAVNDLALKHLSLKTASATIVSANGKIKGLPDVKHIYLDVALQKFYTTAADVKNLLVDTLLPKSISLPEWINLQASMSGTLQTPDIKSLLTTNLGSIDLMAKMNLDSTSAGQGYNGNLSVNDFNVGKLLNQEKAMGKLNMAASVKGTGFNKETVDALVNMTVRNFTYQGYDYKSFKLNGSLKKYFFSGEASLNDQNLNFDLNADLDYTNDVPTYRLKFDLLNADFKALKLAERPLRARGTLDVDMATSDFKVLNGYVDIRRVAIFNGEKLYNVDSLLFASIDQKGKTDIHIDSDLLKGNFTGNINLFSLSDAMKQYVNNYFVIDKVTNKRKPAAPQQFEFNLKLKKTELLTEVLLPALKTFNPGPIHGEFNSTKNDLYVRMSMGKIQYNNLATDSFLVSLNSNKQSLNCNVFLQNVRIDSAMIYGLELDGSVAHDSIKTIFAVRDSLQKQQYKLGGMLYSLKDEFQFKFLKDLVVLNYDHWRVPDDNYIVFGKHGLMTHDLSIALNEQKLFVETKDDHDSTMHVGFRSLYLANLAGMLAGNKTLVAGALNGDVNILRAKQNAIDANIIVHGLTIMTELWGEVALNVQRKNADRFDAKLSIDGVNTDVKANGYYAVTPSSSSVSLKTNISKLDMSLVEPLTSGRLKDLKGILTGVINVSGDLKKPDVSGGITFKDVSFLSTFVNSEFTLTNETINFAPPGLVFDNFKVRDVNKNVANVTGTINTASFKSLILDLTVDAKNFRILNTVPNSSDLFYGRVGLNTHARIKGTSNLPVVDVQLGLTDDSNFTYIVPQADKGVLDQKGIVMFVDKDAKNDPFMASINPQDTVKTKYNGIELTANIELKDKEKFNIIIDPTTGDKLSVQGNTTLSFKMDPMGNMELVGRYEITKGTYSLSFYKLVKRDFLIDKGGTITWAGDPMNATMDLSAIYKVETSPLELVSSQLTSQDEMTQYKQRLPFLVYLNIKGELLTPEISFKLDMPLEKRNAFAGSVYAKLQDINTRESDLNKQVFALLLLQRFMTDNPFENQSSEGMEGTVRSSVSKILTEQLNRLSQNVKGVQLSFDVKSGENYSSGQASGQTSVQLGLSKNLLNDRLVVKLSGNVDVEGQNTNSQNSQGSLTDYIGDLGLEYKMTPDGRLRVTGFRSSDYDMIDGELIRTGAGVIYIKDYNTFKELFKANAK